MADKLIGGLFGTARNVTRQRYVGASAADAGRRADTVPRAVARGKELERRRERFKSRLQRDGVELRDGRLHVALVKASAPPEARVWYAPRR